MDTDLKEYLLSHSLEGIVVADMEGNILACNRTACDLLGYQELELLEQFVGFIFPARSVRHLLPNLLRLAREPDGFIGDILLHDSRDDTIMVRMSAQVWPQPDPTYFLLRFLDWRETYQIVTRLRESNQLASLGTLTRSLSHEILNPVSIIGGHTRRLLDSFAPGSEQEEWAGHVLAGVEKLEAMIQTIRNFLNLPSPSFVRGSLEDLLESSISGIQENAERSGVQIIRTAYRKTPEIYLDAKLLIKAFTAVLLNALDRMPRGGQLTLGLESDASHCKFTALDSGPVLDISQIEEDLSPVHVINDHKTHLNLAIAKRIVDEHGGEFDIATARREGLEIKIRLPIDRRALARERVM
jgi:PAS domain S-box-containing protein